MLSKVFSVPMAKTVSWFAISGAVTRALTYGSTAYFLYHTLPLLGEVIKSERAANDAMHRTLHPARSPSDAEN